MLKSVLERSKEFEQLVISHDPIYNELVRAIELTKKFISDNGLILYGGSGQDYALRLRGDSIYPENAIPDLDFYSPKNVEHSYELADLLFEHGYKEARAINALHVETMRTDIGDNHFVADITYRPQSIFDALPYLEYNGMKIIHPLFQRIDLHSSLAHPYDNPPQEVIFQRWDKDIKRFNKLDKHYPVVIEGDTLRAREMEVSSSMRKYVFCGFAAYAIIYVDFVRTMKSMNADIPNDITPAKFSISSEKIIFDTLEQKFEIVHYSPDKVVEELKLTSVHNFEPYANLLPEKTEGNAGIDIIIYSTRHKLISANSINIDDTVFRTVNVQFLLKHFLSLYFFHKSRKLLKLGATCLQRYVSLMNMIKAVENLKPKVVEELSLSSPLFPSIQTYGNENINLAREIALNRLRAELEDIPQYKVPQNYYPARSAAKGFVHPQFNPEELIFFRQEGREIVNA